MFELEAWPQLIWISPYKWPERAKQHEKKDKIGRSKLTPKINGLRRQTVQFHPMDSSEVFTRPIMTISIQFANFNFEIFLS